MAKKHLSDSKNLQFQHDPKTHSWPIYQTLNRGNTYLLLGVFKGLQYSTKVGLWALSPISIIYQAFPGSSAGTESACNAGDPGLIWGLGRSHGGIGYPLQYSWASLMAQMVKNLPAMRETWVRSLAWEDPLEEGIAIYYSIFAWRIPMDRRARWATVHGVPKSWTRLSN